ncbi:Uncharacterised protein [uncultured archaeon]|nr:Uncharacterised protein [uncultured archaeon]
MLKYRNVRAQGATEYLVLLAVVLIIRLVVISLLGFFPGTASDVGISESQIYWQGAARPLRIYDTTTTVGAPAFCGGMGGGGPQTVYTMNVENVDLDGITLTGAIVDGANKSVCNPDGTSRNSIYFAPSEKKNIDISDVATCTPGSLVNVQIYFVYNSKNINGLRQSGSKNLVFKCP